MSAMIPATHVWQGIRVALNIKDTEKDNVSSDHNRLKVTVCHLFGRHHRNLLA